MRRKAGMLTIWVALAWLTPSIARADEFAIEKNRSQIAAMSELDRVRLSRNLKQYRSMSASERAAIAELNTESSRNPKSAKLIEDYNRWLSRLPPFDRERLAQATDPVERGKLVQTLLDEQRKSRSERDHREDVALFGAPAPAMARKLGPRELDAILGSLESGYLADDLKQHPLPETVTGRDRHLQVLELAIERTKRDRRATSGDDEQFVDAIIDALPDMPWKKRLKENKKPRERRQVLGNAIAAAFREEWQADVDAASPTDEQISKFIANRGGATPERAEKMKTSEGRRMIALRLAADKNPTLRRVGHVVFWLQNGFREPRFMFRTIGERRLDQPARKSTESQPPATPPKRSMGGF